MHAAPPLRVELARSRGWIGFGAALAAIVSGNGVAWALLRADANPAVVLASALCAAVAAAIAGGSVVWRAQAPLVLRWDGQTWLCDDVEGEARLALDLDGWLLLRFVPTGAVATPRWIAASRAAAHGPWKAMRSALYSRRPAAAPDAPSP